MLDEDEFRRWIKSAKHTLRSARRDLSAGDFNWSCFKAQQAAEYAIKAFLWGVGKPEFGHALTRLVQGVGDVPDDIYEACARLDKYYTAPRYADMWSEGSPHEYYTRKEAEEAIYYAELIINFIEDRWKSLEKGGENVSEELS